MAVSIIGPKFYAWDSDTGKPLAFGKVYTYQAGTNTPKATFTTEGGETQNANPVILNGAGYADIFLNGSYKIVVKDADDVEVWTSDPVSDPSQLQLEWVRQRSVTQVNTTTFTADGELTDEYVKGVAVRVKQDSGFVTGTVVGATYADGKTTVELSMLYGATISSTAQYAERYIVAAFSSLGSDLVAHTGTTDTVTEALNNRVIRVSSRTEMKAYDVPAGYQFSLEEGGRSGIFVVKAGTPPSDPEEGIYVVLDNGNYAERIDKTRITPCMFGAVGDGVSNDKVAIQGILNLGFSVVIPANKNFLYSSTITFTKDGQSIIGEGWDSKLTSGSGSVYIETNGFDNIVIDRFALIGAGTNGGIRITGGSSNTKVSSIYFFEGQQRVWIFTADHIQVTGCTFDATGYGVIQERGQSSSHVLVNGNTAIDMVSDFVEANCASGGPSFFWTVTNNVFDTTAGYPTPGTETRFVGITGVNGTIISNNTVNKAGGDSPIHLEDIGGETIINGNIFDNSITSGGNSGYIYLLNSAEHVIISNNIFQRTDNTLPDAFAVSANSNNYNNDITFIGNRVVGNGADGNFGGLLLDLQSGQSLVSNNVFISNTVVCGTNNTSHVSFVGNRAKNCGSMIKLTLNASSKGGKDWLVSGNVTEGTVYDDIFDRQNTNGTFAPKNWFVHGNVFSGRVYLTGQPGAAIGSNGDAENLTITNNIFESTASLEVSGTRTNMYTDGNRYKAP